MKELPFFKFVPTDWLTGDISYMPFEYQGVFVSACAHYWNRECSLAIGELKARLSQAPSDWQDKLSSLLNIDGDMVKIKFLDEQYMALKKQHEGHSLGGKMRWNKPSSNQAIGKHKVSLAILDKEIDIDKDNKKETIKEKVDEKIQVREFVSLKQSEIDRLNSELGIPMADKCFDHLNEYLTNNRKKRKEYVDHNRVIRNWVITSVKEKMAREIKADQAIGVLSPSGPSSKPAAPKVTEEDMRKEHEKYLRGEPIDFVLHGPTGMIEYCIKKGWKLLPEHEKKYAGALKPSSRIDTRKTSKDSMAMPKSEENGHSGDVDELPYLDEGKKQ